MWTLPQVPGGASFGRMDAAVRSCLFASVGGLQATDDARACGQQGEAPLKWISRRACLMSIRSFSGFASEVVISFGHVQIPSRTVSSRILLMIPTVARWRSTQTLGACLVLILPGMSGSFRLTTASTTVGLGPQVLGTQGVPQLLAGLGA